MFKILTIFKSHKCTSDTCRMFTGLWTKSVEMITSLNCFVSSLMHYIDAVLIEAMHGQAVWYGFDCISLYWLQAKVRWGEQHICRVSEVKQLDESGVTVQKKICPKCSLKRISLPSPSSMPCIPSLHPPPRLTGHVIHLERSVSCRYLLLSLSLSPCLSTLSSLYHFLCSLLTYIPLFSITPSQPSGLRGRRSTTGGPYGTNNHSRGREEHRCSSDNAGDFFFLIYSNTEFNKTNARNKSRLAKYGAKYYCSETPTVKHQGVFSLFTVKILYQYQSPTEGTQFAGFLMFTKDWLTNILLFSKWTQHKINIFRKNSRHKRVTLP